MSVTIVSALPKTAQAAVSDVADASSVADGAEDSGAIQDFASLLLGQLSQARSGTSSSLATTLESIEGESADKAEGEGETATANDPLAFLAVLVQAPTENRSTDTPVQSQTTGDLTLTSKTPSAQPVASPEVSNETPSASPSLLTTTTPPGGEQDAAKFAASLRAASDDSVAGSSQKSMEVSPSTTTEAQTSASGMLATAPTTQSSHGTSAALPVSTPLHDSGWSSDFAQKVVWVATSQNQTAELTLNPPNMGSIEISLHIDKDNATATATFTSANAEVRETIETALPRLREMLAGIGIELGQTNVSAESFRQTANQGGESSTSSRSNNDNDILAADRQGSQTPAQIVTALGRGLVDLFA